MADPPTQQLPVAVALPPVPIPQINEDAPSIAEVRMAVSKLKSGKAAGVCGIPGELLKEGGEGMIQGLHRVLTAVWQTGIPFLLTGKGAWSPLSGKGRVTEGTVATTVVLRCSVYQARYWLIYF